MSEANDDEDERADGDEEKESWADGVEDGGGGGEGGHERGANGINFPSLYPEGFRGIFTKSGRR